MREREMREREMHEREMHEREMREREMREREMHEREMHEQEMREREEREREMREREEREQQERRQAQMERLEHLHQAAVHLRHAGLGELSDRVMEQLHELEREIDRPPHHEERGPDFGQLQDQINDLRRAMQELGEQLQQIRRER